MTKTTPATTRAPRYSEPEAEAYADAVFQRVVAGLASFAELLAAVSLAEAMRDKRAL